MDKVAVEGIKKSEMMEKVRSELKVGGKYLLKNRRIVTDKKKKVAVDKKTVLTCTEIYPHIAYFEYEKKRSRRVARIRLCMMYVDIYDMLCGKYIIEDARENFRMISD